MADDYCSEEATASATLSDAAKQATVSNENKETSSAPAAASRCQKNSTNTKQKKKKKMEQVETNHQTHSTSSGKQEGTRTQQKGGNLPADTQEGLKLYNSLWPFWWLVRFAVFLFGLYSAYNLRVYAINEYGRIIHEFDPWYNYRATEYLSEHGWSKFFKWYLVCLSLLLPCYYLEYDVCVCVCVCVCFEWLL